MIFYLEFARQRIISEDFHFGRAHKTSNFKFPVTLGPFTLKKKSCLTIIESYMCQFQFLLAPKVRYDPLHIIDNRRKRKSDDALEHVGLEGLNRIANNEEVFEGQSNVGLIFEAFENIIESSGEVMQTPIKEISQHKRTASDMEAMDIDESCSKKKIKLTKGKEIEGQEKAITNVGK